MSKKVEQYLWEKERQEQEKKNNKRLEVLERAGFAHRVYGQQETTSPEFPLFDDKKYLCYRLEAEEVTEEEYARIAFYDSEEQNETREGGMFGKVGEKLHSVATFCFWACLVISCISGIAVMAEDSDMAFIGLLVAVGGSVSGWFFSLLLYGFGELIVKTTEIAEKIKK